MLRLRNKFKEAFGQSDPAFADGDLTGVSSVPADDCLIESCTGWVGAQRIFVCFAVLNVGEGFGPLIGVLRVLWTSGSVPVCFC